MNVTKEYELLGKNAGNLIKEHRLLMKTGPEIRFKESDGAPPG